MKKLHTNQRDVYFEIPENLLSNSFGLDEHNLSKIHYILDIFSREYFYNDKFNYIPLYSPILKSVVGPDYKKNYINVLLNEGVIEPLRNSYTPKYLNLDYVSSKRYCLTKDYKDVNTVTVLCKNKFIANHSINANRERAEWYSKSEFKYLFQYINEIEIDFKAAMEHLFSLKLINYNDDIRIHDKLLKQIISFRDKDVTHGWFFTHSKRTGRVFNNLSCMARTFRKFLTYKGQKIFNVDGVNSQPFLLNTNVIQTLGPNAMKNNYDCKKYYDITRNGEYYEYMIDRVKTEYGINIIRDDIKDLTYRYFFEKVRPFNEEKERDLFLYSQIFKTDFPQVTKVIYHEKKHDHCLLPIKLQRNESNIYIYNSGIPLSQKFFTGTIHDSNICMEENVEEAKKSIEKSFKERFNLVPTLKVSQI